MKANTIKIWEGPSKLDGAPIMVLLTGIAKSSANTKTGDLLQTWILRLDKAPHHAVKDGSDASVCGNCPLRPALFVKGEVSDRPCYVKTFQAPLSTWKANRGLPVSSPETVRALVAGRRVRRGSYGDPAAVPAYVWDNLADRPGTGYTHQWRRSPELATQVMASVHTTQEATQAHILGFRTFRVTKNAEDLTANEILCPASKEAGARTTCEKCNLCDGSRGPSDRRKSIVIVNH